MTNLLATLLIVVTTNTFHPKQYWLESGTILCGNDSPSYVQQIGSWQDFPPWLSRTITSPSTRDNPDLRIIEVRETKTVTFDYEGDNYSASFPYKVLSSNLYHRVEQSVVTETNGMTITTTVERWEESKK